MDYRVLPICPVLQIKFDFLAAPLSSLFSECCTWRASVRESGDDISYVVALLNLAKESFNFFEGQIEVIEKKSG